MSVMKTSSPYGPGLTVKSPPETITNELSKASGKAKARYPHKPADAKQGIGGAGIKHRALTPGTSPSGS
jgi:hypothetical protein